MDYQGPYDVLRPVFLRTNQPTPISSAAIPQFFYRVHWLHVGVAADMAEAKRIFGGSPVLAPITRTTP